MGEDEEEDEEHEEEDDEDSEEEGARLELGAQWVHGRGGCPLWR